ncbi:hypothetical protein HDV04_000271 [Boothiomyces sp. JEL0838]|nr:hypothetical protein HDV04_000271 [Boothiomyces sp. JEL0838]
MLEEKRAAYKREWVEIILQHSYQSKQKLEHIKKKSDTNIHLTEKKMTSPRVKAHTPVVQCRLPKSWMESKWYRKIANLKPLEITDKDDGITDSPQNSLHFKYMDDSHYDKTPKRKTLSKYSSFKKGYNEFKEPPVLRELSIDKPLEDDASNLWNRETKSDSLVIKSKSIIQMSNAILKHKNLSHSFSSAQQGSSDQNDTLLSFAELNSIDESTEQSENQNPSTEENIEGRITKGPSGNRISQIQGLSLSILKESRKTFLTEKKHSILKNLNYCLPPNPINFKILDERPIESVVESFAAEPGEETKSNLPENNQNDLMVSSSETIMGERTKILKSSDNLRENPDVDNHLVPTDPFFSNDSIVEDDSTYPSDLIPLTFQDLMKQDIKICIPKPLKSLYWKPIPICKE